MENEAKFNEKLQDAATRYILFLVVLHQLLHQLISYTTFWNFIQHYLKKNYHKFSINRFTQTSTPTPLTPKIHCMREKFLVDAPLLKLTGICFNIHLTYY